ncbi:NIF3 family protein [Mycobacterium xenopi 3993]|nr:NIF3 family protein [Mycobacterium xenopi 3993]
MLEPLAGRADQDKWVIYVPPENAEAVRAAVFAVGAGRIGDYSCCSWSVTGTGQFLAHDGASPTIGSIGTVERVAEDRVEVVAPTRLRADVLSAMRSATPTRSPRSTSSRWPAAHRHRARPRWRTAPTGTAARVRVSCARRTASDVVGVRAAGIPSCRCRGSRCAAGRDSLLGAAAAADVQAYVTADLRHHPADEHRRASDVALVDVAHWASEFPWCNQAADILRSRFGESLPVRVCTVCTDPWNLETETGEASNESRSGTTAFVARAVGVGCRVVTDRVPGRAPAGTAGIRAGAGRSQRGQ